jgi:hypothetical protein
VAVTFASEIGDVTISDEDANEIRAKLLHSKLNRSVLAARAIEAALESGGRVVLEHAERLAVLEVLRLRHTEPLRDELALLDAALAASPLDKEYGSDGE